MFLVSTFIRDHGGGFREIGDVAHQPGRPARPATVDGSIEIVVKGEVVVSRAVWDDILLLWCCVMRMVGELHTCDAVETSYPDQPFRLAFEAVRDRVRITAGAGSDTTRATIWRPLFMQEFARAGEEYVEHMTALIGNDVSVEQVRRGVARIEPGARPW